MSYVKDLDAPLLRLSPTDVWTLDDATKGLHAFGGIGSGKQQAPEKPFPGPSYALEWADL